MAEWCMFFAADRAFVNAFLEMPNESDVLVLAASNMASKNNEEHRIETRVASDMAVTKLAVLSNKTVFLQASGLYFVNSVILSNAS
jgi:hypothetical protein